MVPRVKNVSKNAPEKRHMSHGNVGEKIAGSAEVQSERRFNARAFTIPRLNRWLEKKDADWGIIARRQQISRHH